MFIHPQVAAEQRKDKLAEAAKERQAAEAVKGRPGRARQAAGRRLVALGLWLCGEAS